MKNLLIILFILSPITSYSCTCSTDLNFCTFSESDVEESVFIIKMTDSFYTADNNYTKYFDVKIVEFLFGPELELDSITIKIEGSSCEYDVQFFTDTMILKKSAFDELDSFQNYPSHTFWLCQNNFLEYENGEVRGNLETADGLYEQSWETMSFEQFIEWYPNCTTTSSAQEIERQTGYNVFPNPTNNRLNIENETHSKIKYSLFNINGQILESDSAASFTSAEIDMSALPPGVYYIRLEDGIKQNSHRILRL